MQSQSYKLFKASSFKHLPLTQEHHNLVYLTDIYVSLLEKVFWDGVHHMTCKAR